MGIENETKCEVVILAKKKIDASTSRSQAKDRLEKAERVLAYAKRKLESMPL